MITDNTMPQMTGLALAQSVREAAPELPILLISGLALTANLQDVRAAGITDLLPKPHTMEQLRAAVERLLEPSKPLRGKAARSKRR